MPHLSPMNWFLTICFLWLFLLVLSSVFFFQHSSSFKSPSYSSSSTSSLHWFWSLQDGRD